MKTKVSLLALAISGIIAFSSCDDDNYIPEQAVITTFNSKYPDAKRIEWEVKAGYQVADFQLGANEAEAWFDSQGSWLMTETDIAYNDLPAAIRTSFEKSEYATWKKEDVDKLERVDFETTYILEVEQGENEVDLQYAEDGTCIKVIPDNGNSNGYLPEQVPQTITEAINKMYPGATILEYDNEAKGIEVDIIHQGIHKEVLFNSKNEWSYTEWDILQNNVPQLVMDAFKASEYSSFRIDDINVLEKADGLFYVFEVEKGNQEAYLTISAEGVITK